MTPTLGIVLTLALGALVLTAVFFLGEKARKAADRRTGTDEIERLEAARADWGGRADFWIAEHDRALKEGDLLAEELAKESMEFLLDTSPPEVPARSEVRETASVQTSGTSHPIVCDSCSDTRGLASHVGMPDGSTLCTICSDERPARQAEVRRKIKFTMTEEQSRQLQHTALQLYQSKQIGDRAFDYIRKAQQLGLSAREAMVQLEEEVVLMQRHREAKIHRVDAMPELPSAPWAVFVCSLCRKPTPDVPDRLRRYVGGREICPACWDAAQKGTWHR